jgi:hypothetical protein
VRLKILERDANQKQKFLPSLVDKIVVSPDRAVVFGAIPAMPRAAPEFKISFPSPWKGGSNPKVAFRLQCFL